ncbi:hypothetical protein H6P81_005619 [Aristolochia fimbriata]|uniref:Uncharacterized protein n=1 Tax=Aristolochia fimbriata TaxID=158543 RepID=A0AAV7EUZ5_ARIFI|nr:hypothetical protein H6P81_005619 [Aristolochia fimbriata]
MREGGFVMAPAPAMTVTGFVVAQQREEERWRRFDNSVNAVSFGFVATAILISMFLVMAIFERFLRPRSSHMPGPREGGGHLGDVDGSAGVPMKPGNLSPLMSVYAKGVSVLMPGQDIPTYIAHPAPPPCPPERISWPAHQHSSVGCPSNNSC